MNHKDYFDSCFNLNFEKNDIIKPIMSIFSTFIKYYNVYM